MTMLFPSIVQWIKKHLMMASCIGFLASPMCFAQTPIDEPEDEPIEEWTADTRYRSVKVFDPVTDKFNNFSNPEYIGGDSALVRFLQENLKYPTEALKNGMEGVVVVRFVVTVEGYASNIELVRGFDPACDKAVIRAIRLLEKWKPGMVDGKEEPMYMRLPITFKLSKPLPGAY